MIITDGPVSLQKVCDAAKLNCSDILIIGRHKDGTSYFASTGADANQLLWWIEDFKAQLLSGKWFHELDDGEQG